MSSVSFKSIILGFIAGAIAVPIAHELLKLALVNYGYLSAAPWAMDADELTGLPGLVSEALIGGIWGVVFAMIAGELPAGSLTWRGLVFGILGPGLVGLFVLVPLLLERPIFAGGDPNAIWPALVMLAGWGALMAWLYGLFSHGRLP